MGELPCPTAFACSPGSHCVGAGPQHLGDSQTSESELEDAVSCGQCSLFPDSMAVVHLLAGLSDSPQTKTRGAVPAFTDVNRAVNDLSHRVYMSPAEVEGAKRRSVLLFQLSNCKPVPSLRLVSAAFLAIFVCLFVFCWRVCCLKWPLT